MLKRWGWTLPLLFLTACLPGVADTPRAPAPPAGPARAHDWPGWRGSNRDGISTEKGLLQNWPRGGPKLAWKVKGLGEGFSTPSVAAGRIFCMGNVQAAGQRDLQECVIALKEEDGSPLWTAPLGKGGEAGGYPGPRCTPTVDGDRVYALGLRGTLVCLEAATGKEVWRKNLPKDFGGRVGGWGYSESPLIDGDKLICTPGGKSATLAALNKKTGETIWKGEVPEADEAHYSSVIAADAPGGRQYVQFLGGGVVGLDAATGKFLWRYDEPNAGTANCSTPIYHDGCVFAAAGYGRGGGKVKLTRDGDKVKAEEVYFTRDMINQHGNMVLIDGYVYGACDGSSLTCLDFKSGKTMWKERQAGKGSISFADGRLYYRNEGGPIVLIAADPSGYKEEGRFDQPDRSGHNAWPHPVVANGKLYIRDQDVLLCYEVKK
jgi:outer membrane protein assembly factor BamB